jgi:hypothetical protein
MGWTVFVDAVEDQPVFESIIAGELARVGRDVSTGEVLK